MKSMIVMMIMMIMLLLMMVLMLMLMMMMITIMMMMIIKNYNLLNKKLYEYFLLKLVSFVQFEFNPT